MNIEELQAENALLREKVARQAVQLEKKRWAH